MAEIKLRHLNREYILKRTAEVEQLREDIAKMEDTLSSKKKIQGVIVQELKQVAKEYGQPEQWRAIADANGLANPRLLRSGARLVLPALKQER